MQQIIARPATGISLAIPRISLKARLWRNWTDAPSRTEMQPHLQRHYLSANLDTWHSASWGSASQDYAR